MRWATSAFSGCSAASFAMPAAVPSAYGRRMSARRLERQPRDVRDVEAGERHRQRLAAEPLALAERAVAAQHVLRHPLLHQRALRGGEGVQDVPRGAGERALVARLLLALERRLRLRRRVAGVDRHGRLLVGEQDPVAILLRQLAPGAVDVVAERHQDVAQVLPVPGGRPGGDGALADGERVVRHHRALGDLVDPAQAVAFGQAPSGVLGENDSAYRSGWPGG